jgi:hypothetical protein
LANTASAASTNHVTITLEAALTASLATTEYCEIIPNPYGNLTYGSNEYVSFGGIPAIVASPGKYFWLQTWGPTWIVPGGASSITSPGGTAKDRMCYFVGDGSINSGSRLTTDTDLRQPAGFIIQNDAGVGSGGGPPFVMLQITP